MTDDNCYVAVASPLAASSCAEGPAAVEQAVTGAVGGLGGGPPALVLVFHDVGMAPQEALAQAAAAAPGCRLVGMTSRVVMSATGVRPGGSSALAFGPPVSVGVGLARDASRDLHGAGRAAAEEALAGLRVRPNHSVLLLFLDPRSGDQAAAIDGAYAVAGHRIPLAGGGADGSAPRVMVDRVHCADAVVAVGLSSPGPIGVGVAHGCRRRSVPAIATRTEGRTVRELDGRPAEEVYLEALGLPSVALDDEAFEALAVMHPLAQPELRGELRLRHVISRGKGGGLACATAIPPNAAVWFTEQTDQTIIDSAAAAVQDALKPLPRRPEAGLVFDCAARRRALGSRLGDEAGALTSAFGGVPALAGLYTRGEVGRTRGAKGDRNHAIVVVAFG